MPRKRSEKRDKAYELWKGSDGKMLLKDIAAALDVSDTQIRKWKNQDRWDDIKDKVTLPIKNSNVTKRNKHVGFQPGNKAAVGHGPPKGNKNAVGNKGGNGGPNKNNNATKHGFFKQIFPDDEETLDIINEIAVKSPLEILWEQIVIQYTAIARAQKLMFVKDQDDKTIERVGYSKGKIVGEKWEVQQAWDKHANFLTAQSRAIKTLESLINRYEELLKKDLDTEEQQLRMDKLKAEIAKLKGEEMDIEDDGFMEALQGSVKEVWADEEL